MRRVKMLLMNKQGKTVFHRESTGGNFTLESLPRVSPWAAIDASLREERCCLLCYSLI
jgi:hypothetical protein